jgi:hypothetical protein
MAAVPNCEVRRTNAFAYILFLSPIQCIAKIAPHIAIGVGSAIKGRKVGWAETWGLERSRLPPMMASLAVASHCPAHPLPAPKPDRLALAHRCSCSPRFDTAPDKRPPPNSSLPAPSSRQVFAPPPKLQRCPMGHSLAPKSLPLLLRTETGKVSLEHR